MQLSEQVASAVDQIDKLIGNGGLVAGQRLVESDLMERLGLGRVPVREALRILAGDGVVELVPNRGARVRTYSGEYIAQMLKALTALLCEGVEEFLESPDYETGMLRLKTLDNEISDSIENVDIFGLLKASGRYQEIIFEISGNTYLMEIHRRVHFHHFNRQIIEAFGFSMLARLASAYGGVTRALEANDSGAACAVLRSEMSLLVAVLRNASSASSTRPDSKAVVGN